MWLFPIYKLFIWQHKRYDFYGGEPYMKNFLAHITEQVPEIFNYEKKEILSLTGEESKSYNNQILSDIYKKDFKNV